MISGEPKPKRGRRNGSAGTSILLGALILCVIVLAVGLAYTDLAMRENQMWQNTQNTRIIETVEAERDATKLAIETTQWQAIEHDLANRTDAEKVYDVLFRELKEQRELNRILNNTNVVTLNIIKKLQDQVGEPWAADYQQMQDATVWITTVERDPSGEGPKSWGSGVFLSDTQIMTAHHVAVNVSLMEQNMVVVYQGKEYRITGVHLDPDSDLATIDTEPIPAKFIPELLERDMRLGDTVVVIGTPMDKDLHLRVSQGIVSNTDRGDDSGRFHGWGVMMGTDATAGPGNSGGPVFVEGKLAALLVGGYGRSVGPISLILPINEFN